VNIIIQIANDGNLFFFNNEIIFIIKVPLLNYIDKNFSMKDNYFVIFLYLLEKISYIRKDSFISVNTVQNRITDSIKIMKAINIIYHQHVQRKIIDTFNGINILYS